MCNSRLFSGSGNTDVSQIAKDADRPGYAERAGASEDRLDTVWIQTASYCITLGTVNLKTIDLNLQYGDGYPSFV